MYIHTYVYIGVDFQLIISRAKLQELRAARATTDEPTLETLRFADRCNQWSNGGSNRLLGSNLHSRDRSKPWIDHFLLYLLEGYARALLRRTSTAAPHGHTPCARQLQTFYERLVSLLLSSLGVIDDSLSLHPSWKEWWERGGGAAGDDEPQAKRRVTKAASAAAPAASALGKRDPASAAAPAASALGKRDLEERQKGPRSEASFCVQNAKDAVRKGAVAICVALCVNPHSANDMNRVSAALTKLQMELRQQREKEEPPGLFRWLPPTLILGEEEGLLRDEFLRLQNEETMAASGEKAVASGPGARGVAERRKPRKEAGGRRYSTSAARSAPHADGGDGATGKCRAPEGVVADSAAPYEYAFAQDNNVRQGKHKQTSKGKTSSEGASRGKAELSEPNPVSDKDLSLVLQPARIAGLAVERAITILRAEWRKDEWCQKCCTIRTRAISGRLSAPPTSSAIAYGPTTADYRYAACSALSDRPLLPCTLPSSALGISLHRHVSKAMPDIPPTAQAWRIGISSKASVIAACTADMMCTSAYATSAIGVA